MTDSEYEKAKERINYYLFPLKDILLKDWHVTYEYHRERDEDQPYTLAQASPLWEYKRGTIRLFIPCLNAEDEPARIVNCLMHEMVHFMLDAVTDLSNEDDNYRKIVERTTQEITDSFQDMFERPDLFEDWHKANKKQKALARSRKA